MTSEDGLALAPANGEVEAPGLDTTACDREAIHVPGSIQPHGLLLIAERRGGTARLVGGAGAIEQRLADDWLGRPLDELLGLPIDGALAQIENGTRVVSLGEVAGTRETFDTLLHVAGEHILVELEPQPDAPASAATVLSHLDALGAGFERAVDLQQLCERAAEAFRELTGFDRVMIYRFLDDSAGTVVAEARDPALHTFLNHHFPGSDIPRQARALYVRNRVRTIPDVEYVPAPIRGERDLAGIDLSDAALRSVSPIHVQYLRNMGLAASASISIVRDGLLWGLVACHHRSPRGLSYQTRVAAQALAGGLARQVHAREEAETYRERIRLRAAEDAILSRFEDDVPLAQLFEAMADDIRRMLDATGFAVLQGGQVTSVGACPADADIRNLVRALNLRSAAEPFSSASLRTRLAEADAYRDVASGVLAMHLTTETPVVLVWFRAEELETVNWAGNPHKAVTGPMGELTPRKSFASWGETVSGRARRWTLGEVEAASRFRRALYEVRQSHRLRELNRELGATLADKEALLVEKDHLLREVNHRVQNSLQLVQSFLALQARAEGDPALVEHLGEAQRRLSAVALVHRRLYQGENIETVDLGRYLDELVGEMRASMGEEWQRHIALDLAPMLISADRAVHVGLILTELVINANKYAYGGQPGPVSISLEEYRNQFRLVVADRGAGKTREHQGFGTRMMNAMVQRLGGTIERTDNRPGMRVIVAAPVEQG